MFVSSSRRSASFAIAGSLTATVLAAPALAGGATLHSASAGNAADLTAAVDAYRAALGDLNTPNPGSVGAGRRQIDWDAAPDAVSAPNPFAGGFFNQPNFPVARGVVFETPGTGFQLSATAASGVGIEFSNIDPSYDETFEVFSPERLFTALDSNIVDVYFKVPGVDRNGLSHGFGVVFTDVDLDNTTSLEFFDANGDSLGLWYAESGAGWESDESLTLLGVVFDEPIVAHVRITNGNASLAWGTIDGQNGVDLVTMDDLIFGEPIPAQPVPGDADGDGLVRLEDLLAVLASFGACPGCPTDFDGNGWVDFYDLLTVLANYDSI